MFYKERVGFCFGYHISENIKPICEIGQNTGNTEDLETILDSEKFTEIPVTINIEIDPSTMIQNLCEQENLGSDIPAIRAYEHYDPKLDLDLYNRQYAQTFFSRDLLKSVTF